MAEAPAAVQPNAVDTGLASLCLIAGFFGVPDEAGELVRRHLPSSSGASAEELVRIARKLGLKARIVATKWDRLVKTPLPAIAEDRDGAFVVATRFVDAKLLVQRPTGSRGRLFERAEFEKAWSGRLVLLGRRASISNVPDIFDLRWFAAAVQRYWHIIGEVVVASFFLQLLGLVSPLFFQGPSGEVKH